MIDSYSFGNIVVDGEKYADDVIIFPDHVKDNWWRKEGHILHPKDLNEVMDASPEVLVVGTGASGRMKVPASTQEFIESRGIELIVEKSESACETYNDLSDERDIVAAIHLTC